MRIDVVSIFPEYLAPLRLSLAGKAQDAGLLDVHVHDLRDWTHDRHRTVDDTPYGGGAGMVMRPEPWGEALDELLPARRGRGAGRARPRPASRSPRRSPPSWPPQQHLVFACGRYEGIDQRVLDDAAPRMRCARSRSATTCSTAARSPPWSWSRRWPGCCPGSWATRSRWPRSRTAIDGLLEYPVYTKPASWRGHDVPAVLLSGDHARIAAWRHDQSLRRTARRAARTCCTPAGPPPPRRRRLVLRAATRADAGELLTLQLACWVSEAQDNPDVDDPAAARGPRRRRGLAGGVDHARACTPGGGWWAPCAAGSTETPGTWAG